MPAHAALNDHAHIAFLTLSEPQELLQDAWAEAGQRILQVGLREQATPQIEADVRNFAYKARIERSRCFATSELAVLTLIIPDNLTVLRSILEKWQQDGLLSKQDCAKLIQKLGLRSSIVHPLLPHLYAGAGI